jgi:hypothetical protein
MKLNKSKLPLFEKKFPYVSCRDFFLTIKFFHCGVLLAARRAGAITKNLQINNWSVENFDY